MKKIVILLMPLTLYACSFGSTLYNNFDSVVLWQISDYVKLEKAQKRQLQQISNELIVWHRHNELPKYQALIKDLKENLVNNTLTLERIEQYNLQTTQLKTNIINYIEPKLPSLLATLTTKQYNQLFKNISKKVNNRKDTSEKKHQTALLERMEKWYGKLNNQQHTIINKINEQRKANRPIRQQQREAWLITLNSAVTSSSIDNQQVNRILWNSFKTSNLTRYSQSSDWLSIWLLSNEEQKSHLIREIDEILEIIADCIEN